jgi:hypothetical protein
MFDAVIKYAFFEYKMCWRLVYEDGAYLLYQCRVQIIFLKIFLITYNKTINESTYLHGIDIISNCLPGILGDVPDCAPVIVITSFFLKVKIFLMFEVLSPKI